MEKTDYFQYTKEFYGGRGQIRYYRVIETPGSQKISLEDIGVLELPSREWKFPFGDNNYGIFRISWWKYHTVSGGEGNLINGRVIKNRIPGCLFGDNVVHEHSLLECYLPPVYYKVLEDSIRD